VTRRLRALAAAGSSAAVLALLVPGVALGHQLSGVYQSRLPLAVYLAGAAATVALSFIFVLVRDVRAERPTMDQPTHLPPAAIRSVLRALGLIAWVWIVLQGIAGGESNGDVGRLFLWVYGWVGVAMASFLIGPVWHFLDPFSTLHDLGAALLRRLSVTGWDVADYPERLGKWPAIVGFLVVVWLELVLTPAPSTLFVIVVGYTALTLAMMAQFGRDAWRANAEVFTVWFRLLGRLAPYALADEDGRVRRRPFASGLLEGGWAISDVVLIAFGVGSILFDGLSQTQPWFDLFGVPALPGKTLLMIGFLGIIALAALGVTRVVGRDATAAGLLPIAAGYLIAHYLTYLLIDGQNILVAISDPFQQGWDLFGTAFYQPTGAFLPPGLVWTLQLAAVVGGHMLGAWAGHVVATMDAPKGLSTASLRTRQLPLAIVMVALTTLTLWSLGQALVVTAPSAVVPPATAAPAQAIATSARG
jgi:hypothetical protein